jgi:hypothetical protein
MRTSTGATRTSTSRGGIWDGNTTGNPRHEETNRHGYTGAMINFRHVRGLALLDMRQKNSSAYHTRLSGVRDFRIERIRFEDTIEAANQDGVHVAGQCEDGLIRDISAVGECSTGDDLIALNADDALDRSETRGKLGGPIRRLRIEGVRADDCHTFVRMASVWSEIADIEIHDVRGGCRVNLLNADALRHCLSPLFRRDDPRYAGGAGLLRRIRVRDCTVYKTGMDPSALLRLDERMEDFEVERFTRLTDRDAALHTPTIQLGYIKTDSIALEGISRGEAEACQAASTCTQLAAAALPHAPGTPARYRVEAGVDTQGRFICGCGSFEKLRIERSQCDPLPDPDWTVARGQYVG